MLKTLLEGNFHTHLTVAQEDAKQAYELVREAGISCRLDTIVLEGDGNIQYDPMLTLFHKTRQGGDTLTYSDIERQVFTIAQTLKTAGVDVQRVKIEHEEENTLPPSKEHYRECHICVKIPKHFLRMFKEAVSKTSDLEDWRFSNTTRFEEGDFCWQFVNKRFYEGTVDKVDKECWKATCRIWKILNKDFSTCGAKVELTKIETAVYDSNLNHDHWWA